MELNKRKELQILFIGKKSDMFSEQAAAFVLAHYPSARIIYSSREKNFPKEILDWKGDLIISYLCQWIIPKSLLEKATLAALNFHPGPPEYPGIGCTNFAVYEQATEFGVTCHRMSPKVDTGEITAVKRFPIFEDDTVYSITQSCYAHILNMFYEIFYLIMSGENLPVANEKWKRKPYLRKQLDALCQLTPDMTLNEIDRRIKATTYLQPWVFIFNGENIINFSTEDIKNKTYLNYLSPAAV